LNFAKRRVTESTYPLWVDVRPCLPIDLSRRCWTAVKSEKA